MARERVEAQRISSGRWRWARRMGHEVVRRSLHTYTTRAKAMRAGREKPKPDSVLCDRANRNLWMEYQEVLG